jgi:hypothetical protein
MISLREQLDQVRSNIKAPVKKELTPREELDADNTRRRDALENKVSDSKLKTSLLGIGAGLYARPYLKRIGYATSRIMTGT